LNAWRRVLTPGGFDGCYFRDAPRSEDI